MSYYSVGVTFLFILCIKLTVSAPMQDTLGRRAREKGCYYLSNHYDNGERIVTNEPCLNCTCLNSMLMCYLRICPFIKPVGEECIIERDDGDCCPKIWCPEVINEKKCDDPNHDEKHTQHPGCYLDDKYYPDGAQLPRDPKRPCEVCYCIRNSTACVMQECELKVEGCSPVYKEGQCCPCRYNCTYEESTTAPPGVTLQELAEGCNLPDGTFVEDGEAVNSTNPCEHCYCMRNEVVCAIQECQAPGDDCRPLPPKPDQCCPDRYECPVLQSPESSRIHPGKPLSFTTVFSTSAEISTEFTPIKHSEIKGSSQKGTEAGKYSPSSSVKGAPSKVSHDQETTPQSITDEYAQTDKPSLEILNLDKAVSKPQPGKKFGIKGGSKIITSTSTAPHELAVLSESDDDSGDQFNDDYDTSSTVKEYQITRKTTMDDYSFKPSSGTSIKGFGVKGGVSEKIHPAASIPDVSPDSSTEFHVKESTTHVPLEKHTELSVTEISSEVTTQTTLESISDGRVTSKIFLEEAPKPSLKPSGVKGIQSEAVSDPESNFHVPLFKPIGIKGVPAKVDESSTQKKPAIKHVGVKGTPQEEHHFRVKGKQPTHIDSLRRRPILPIGAIPGEIRPSTVSPVTKDGIEKLQPVLAVPGEGVCRIGDIVYRNGQVMKPIHVCKKDCRCINSVIICSDVICNEPEGKNVSHCRIIQKADECCPRYECDNFGSTDSINLSVTTANNTQDTELIVDDHLFGNKTSPIDSGEEIVERNLTTTSLWQSTLDLITSTISDKLLDFTKGVTDQPQNKSEIDILEFISLTTEQPQKINQTVSQITVTEIPSTSADQKTTAHIITEKAFQTSSLSPESSTLALIEDETNLSDSPKETSQTSLIIEESEDISAGSTLSLNISVEEVTQTPPSFTEIPRETIKGDFTQSTITDESFHGPFVTEASKDILTEEKLKQTPNISIDEISQTTTHITEVPEEASTGIPALNTSIEEISQTTAHITELPIETLTGILTLNISPEEVSQTPPSTEVQEDTLSEENESKVKDETTTYSLPDISDDILVTGKINDSYDNTNKTSVIFDVEEIISVTENNISIPVSVTNPTTVESAYEEYTTIKYSSDPTLITFNLSTVIPFEETETKNASIISLKTSTLPTSLSESSQTDFEVTSSVFEIDKHSDGIEDKAYQTVTSVPAIETIALTKIKVTELPEVSEVEISTSSKQPEVNETFYTTLEDIKSRPPIDNFPEIIASTKFSFEDVENISEEVSNNTEVYDVTPQTESSKNESTTYKDQTGSIENEVFSFSAQQTTTVSPTVASESVDTTKIETVTFDIVTSNGSISFVEEKDTSEVAANLSTTSTQRFPGTSAKPETTTEIFPKHDVIHITEVSEIPIFDKISITNETIIAQNQTVKPLIEDNEEATEYFVTEYSFSEQPKEGYIIGKESTKEKVSVDEETQSTLTTISSSKISDFSIVKGEIPQDINPDVEIISERDETSTIATDTVNELSTLHYITSTETDLSDSDSVSKIASTAISITNESLDGDIYRNSTAHIATNATEELHNISDSAEVHTLDSSILGSLPTDFTEINEEDGRKISTILSTPDIETSTGFSDLLESSYSDKPLNVTISEVKEHLKPIHDTFSDTEEPFLTKDISPPRITQQENASPVTTDLKVSIHTSTTLKLDETASETTTTSSDTSETVTDKDYQELAVIGDISAGITDSPSKKKTAHDSTLHLSPETVDQFTTQKESTSSGKEIINTSTGTETEIITERSTGLPEAPSSHSDDIIDETTAVSLNISTENIVKDEGVKHIPQNLILELGTQSEQGIASVDEYPSKVEENGTVSFEQPVTSYDSFGERKTEPVVTEKNIPSVLVVKENISNNATFIEDTTIEYMHKLGTTTKLPELHDKIHEIKSDLFPFSITIASELETQTDSKQLQNVSEYITESTSVDKTVPKAQENETESRERTTAESFWHVGTTESTTSLLGTKETVAIKEDSEENSNTKTTDFVDITLISTTKKPTHHFESAEYTVLPAKPNIINDTNLTTISANSQDVVTVHDETLKIPEQISESGAANASETITIQLNTDVVDTEDGEPANVTSVNNDLSTLGNQTDFPENVSEYGESLHTKEDLKDALSTPTTAEEESDVSLVTSVIPDVEDIISKENHAVSDDRHFTTVYEIKNAFNDSAEKITETEFVRTSTETLSKQAPTNESTFQISEKVFSTESSFIIQTSKAESTTQPSKEAYSTHATGDEFEIHTLEDEITTQVSNIIDIQTSKEIFSADSLKADFETSTEDLTTQKSTNDFATDALEEEFETQSPEGEIITSAPDKEVATQFIKFETQTLIDGLVTNDEGIPDAVKDKVEAHVLKDEFTHLAEEDFTTQTLESEHEFAISSQQGVRIGSAEEEFMTQPSKDIPSTHTQEDDIVTQYPNLKVSTIVSKGEFSTQPSEEEFVIYTLKKDAAPQTVIGFETHSSKSEVTLQTSQEKLTTQTVNETFSTDSSKEGSSDEPKETFVTELSKKESSSDEPKEYFVTESLIESSDISKGEFATESTQQKSSSDAPQETFSTESTETENSSNEPKDHFATESLNEESSDASKEQFTTESPHETSSSDAPKETFATEPSKQETSSNEAKEHFAPELLIVENSDASKEFATESPEEKSSSNTPNEKFATEFPKEESSSNETKDNFFTQSLIEESSDASKEEFTTKSLQEISSPDAQKEIFTTESSKEESSNEPKEHIVTESLIEESSDASNEDYATESSQEKSSSDALKDKYATELTKEESYSNEPKDHFVTESLKEESSDASKEEFTTESPQKISYDAPKETFSTEPSKKETYSNEPKKHFVTQSLIEESSDASKEEFTTEPSQEKSSSDAPKETIATEPSKEETSSNEPKDHLVTESLIEESSDVSKEEFTTESPQEISSPDAQKEIFATESSKEESSNELKEHIVTESLIEESYDASKEEFVTESSQEKSSSDAPKEKFATESTKEESSSSEPKDHFVTESLIEESSNASKEELATESPNEESSSDASKEIFATEPSKEESSSNEPKEYIVTESLIEESSDASKEEFATESSQAKGSSDAAKETFATEFTKEGSSSNEPKDHFVTESLKQESSDASKGQFTTKSPHETSSSDAPKETFATEPPKEETSSDEAKEHFVTESLIEESPDAPKEEFGTESPQEKSSSDAPAEEFVTKSLNEESSDTSKGEFVTQVSKDDFLIQTTKKELAPQTLQEEPITEISKAAFVTQISNEELTTQTIKEVFSVKIFTQELGNQATDQSETSKAVYEHSTNFIDPAIVLSTGSESKENISTESSLKVPDISAAVLEEKLTESDVEVETSTETKDYAITLVPDNAETETTEKISSLPTDLIQPESFTSKSTVTYPPSDYTTLSLGENVKVVFVENTTGKFPEILSVIKVSHEEPSSIIDGSLSKFHTTEDSLTSSPSPSSADKSVQDDLTDSTVDIVEATVYGEDNKDLFQETTSVINDKLTSAKIDNVDFPIISLNLTNLNETKSSLNDDISSPSTETTFTVTSTPSTTSIIIKASTDATDETPQDEILKTQTTKEFSVIQKNISSEFEGQLFTKLTDLAHVTSHPILPGITEVIIDDLSTPVSVNVIQDQSEGSLDSENIKDSHFSEESDITDYPATDIHLLESTESSRDSETHTFSTERDSLVDGAHSSSASESPVFVVEEDSSPTYTEIPLDIKDIGTALNSSFPQDVKFQQTTVSYSFQNEMSHDSTQQEKHAGTFIPVEDLTSLSEIITNDSTTSEIPHLATNFTKAANETKEVLTHKEASPQVIRQELINSSSTDFSVSSPAYENFSQAQDVQTSTETEILTEQTVHSTKLFAINNETDKEVSPDVTISIGSSVADSPLPTTVSVSPSNNVFETIDGASPIPTNDSLDSGELETEISIEIADENQTQEDLLENEPGEFDVSTSYTKHDLPAKATTIQPPTETTFKEILEDLSEHSAEEIDTYTETFEGSSEIKTNITPSVETTQNISSTDVKEYETSSKLPADVVIEEITDSLKTTMLYEEESSSSFAGTSSETITQTTLTEERLPIVESHSKSYIDEKSTGSEEFQDNAFLGIQTTTEKDSRINETEVETEKVSSSSPAEFEEKYEFSTSSYDNDTNLYFTKSSETSDITEPEVTEKVHEFSIDTSSLLPVTDTSSRITETSSVTSTTLTLPVKDFESDENETYSQTEGTAEHITAKPIKDYVLQKNITKTAVTTPFSKNTTPEISESDTTTKHSELLPTVVSHLTESTLTDTETTRTANISDESSFISQYNDSSSEVPHTFDTEEIITFISTDFPEEGKHGSPEVSSVTSPQTDQGTKTPFTAPVLLETVSEIFGQSSPASETHGFFESQYSTPSSGFDQEDSQHPLQEEGICFYEGRIFQSAKQIPRRDPCEFCFCFRGDIICLQQACPPPIKDCFATPIPGFCCPRFHCPVQEMHFNLSTTTTTTAKPRLGQILQKTVEATGCEIDGKVYRVNQLVRPASGPCMQCRCEYGGIMKCDPKDCQPQPPLLLRLNQEYFRK